MESHPPDKTQHKLIGRTLTDYLLYFPAVTVSALMGLVTVTVLSRFFSPADYGHYALAFSTMLLLSMVTGLWLHSSVVRLLPQYITSNQVNEFIGTLSGAGTLVAMVVVLLYVLILPLFKSTLDEPLYQLLWLVPPGVIILTIFGVLQEGHRIQGRSALYSGLTLLRVVGGFLIGLFLAVPLGWGPLGMLLGMIIVMAGAIGGHLILAGHRLIGLARTLRWSGSILRDMLAFTMPIVGLNLASTILAVSDRYLIEGYLNSYDLGIYAASYSIAEGGMRLIANTFLIATEPTVFNSWVTYGPRTAFQLIERLFRYYLMLALPALVGLSLLRYEIITLFTTSEYANGSAVVIYVSLAIFMHGYSLIVGLVFDATKRTMIPFVTFLIAALFNVVINLLLLARFGYMAAAWSTCAGYGLLLVLNVIAARRIVHLKIVGGYLWRIGLATAGMGGLIYFLQQRLAVSLVNLFLQVGIAVVVYILFLLIVKGLEEAEILAVKHRAQQILTRALGLVRYKVEAG